MKRHSGKLRIIGGQHKGRKISFFEAQGLRPTPDRIRETLFNWLTLYIEGSACLDLFAGSGAIGLEALSRGAKTVTFVESNNKTAEKIRQNLRLLNSANYHVFCQNALFYLEKTKKKFDIIFLDPPFNSQLLQKSINTVQELELLNNSSWVYLEYASNSNPPKVPHHWQLHGSTKAGDTKACLYRVKNLGDPATNVGQVSPRLS